MRLVRFGCAMSLDGYIAGPDGEYDNQKPCLHAWSPVSGSATG